MVTAETGSWQALFSKRVMGSALQGQKTGTGKMHWGQQSSMRICGLGD